MQKKFEKKNGTGVLFTNKNIPTDKHPVMTGNVITPDGKEYRIAAWSRLTEAGNKYLSLAITEPMQKEEGNKQDSNQSNDLPF